MQTYLEVYSLYHSTTMHCACKQTRLTRVCTNASLHICADSLEPLLLTDAISFKICAGSFSWLLESVFVLHCAPNHMLVHKVCCALCPLEYFSKSTLKKKIFRNIIRVSNSLDPDQARCFVMPNLSPNV